MVLENPRTYYTLPVLRIFDTRGDSQDATPAYNESRLYVFFTKCHKDDETKED
jgi:hypothetical protein